MNQLLEIEFKTYVRTIGCFPEKANGQDFLGCIQGLEYSERVSLKMYQVVTCMYKHVETDAESELIKELPRKFRQTPDVIL